MANSGYVLAGFETLHTILNNFAIRDTKDSFDDHFTPQQVSSFLSQNCDGFLHSFGQNFTGRKKYDKYVDKEAKLFDECRASGFFDNCKFIADSGGFQASIGRIDEHETDLLIELYHDFLENKYASFDRAFILDLPPGPGCKLFKTFDDLYDRNLDTYTRAKNLPQEARDKIIYINHFRSPKLWDIYSDILNQPGMFDSFQYFGTGGIVANMSSDTAIPCIIYVLPMIPLINKAIEHGRERLPFHILGGANFRDILCYEVFSKLVREKHGVELEITYDSSGLYKAFMIGRFLYYLNPDTGLVRKVDVRTGNLNKRFDGGQKVLDIYTELINKLSEEYNLKPIQMTDVYSEETGTFFEDVKVYSMFSMLDTYGKVQQYMRRIADEIYPLYEAGELAQFNSQIELVTRNLNQGKITRKQKAKSYSVVKSLEMLANLDENYCKYIVNKHLAKDEFIDLETENRIMTI